MKVQPRTEAGSSPSHHVACDPKPTGRVTASRPPYYINPPPPINSPSTPSADFSKPLRIPAIGIDLVEDPAAIRGEAFETGIADAE